MFRISSRAVGLLGMPARANTRTPKTQTEFEAEMKRAAPEPSAKPASAAPVSGLAAIFPGKPSDWGPPKTTPDPPAAPTMESLFGSSPFVENPVERLPDGSLYNLNPIWFATAETASKVAQMLGGTVVAVNDFTTSSSPVQQLQPNLMVKMPNGFVINAGYVASLYSHGFSQSYIDELVAGWVDGYAT